MSDSTAATEPACSRREFLGRIAAAPAALVLGGVLAGAVPPCAAAQTGPVVNASRCVGCGRCARIAKNTFAINSKKKKAYVKNPKGDSAELIAQAAAKCRRKAITIQ